MRRARQFISVFRTRYSVIAAAFAGLFAVITFFNPNLESYSGFINLIRDNRFDEYELKFEKTRGVIFFPTRFIDPDFGRTLTAMDTYSSVFDVLNSGQVLNVQSVDGLLEELRANNNVASTSWLIGDIERSADDML